MKYIESTPLPDGTYDHTEVRAAYEDGRKVEFNLPWWIGRDWICVENDERCGRVPTWNDYLIYRAQVPDTYGIHESSSTPREVKGDAGPAVAEMLLDRIKELEDAIESIRIYGSDTLSGKVGYYDNYSEWLREGITEMVDRAREALNKEPK